VIQHGYWKINIFNVSIIELNGPFSMDMLKFEYFNVEMMVNIKHWSNLSTLKQNGWLKSAKAWAHTPQSSLAISPLRAEIYHCWKFVLPERGLVFETVGIRHIRDARQVGAPLGHVEHEKMDQTGRFKVVPAPPQF